MRPGARAARPTQRRTKEASAWLCGITRCRRGRASERESASLLRDRLDDTHGRTRRHDAFELQPGTRDHRLVLAARAFATAGHGEHDDVEPLAGVRLVAGRDHALD